MPLISIVINVDTRPSNDSAEHMFSGTVNRDFLVDGVMNKRKFFEGFDTEVILYVDEHLSLGCATVWELQDICDVVCVRRHTSEPNFNDYNYLRALSLASGNYVAHFDQDTAAFTKDAEPIKSMMAWLEDHRFVSYPSHWSPGPVVDPSFGGRTWASTRFFMTKRERLDIPELMRCIQEPNYAYQKYGDSPRRCNWLEHFLTLTNNDSCYYPPVELDKYAVFSWRTYKTGTLPMLNNLPYDEVEKWVKERGIHYPNDLNA